LAAAKRKPPVGGGQIAYLKGQQAQSNPNLLRKSLNTND